MPPLSALPPLLLHAGARIEWTRFTVHLSTVVGLLALAALYEWRVRQGAGSGERGGTDFRREGTARHGVVPHAVAVPHDGHALAPRAPLPAPRSPRPTQRALFYAALLAIFLSLNGWLHDLSDYYLFSAHMVQHLLLTFVACPLLVMGTPGWMLRPALRLRGVGAAARALTRPAVCFAAFNLVVVAWHLPVMYNAALAHHELHIVQHLMFMVAAVLMWWPILSPLPELPRLSYPMQMLYLFLMSIPMSIVAVYIVYAQSVLYPAYASAPRIWGITPRMDQMIGGLIMWLPGGLFFFTIISVLFFKWQAMGEDSQVAAQVPA